MPQERFTGESRFKQSELWQHKMRESAKGFVVQRFHLIPARDGNEATVELDYKMAEGEARVYSRCIICGEFLLGRELPEKELQQTIRTRRPG